MDWGYSRRSVHRWIKGPTIEFQSGFWLEHCTTTILSSGLWRRLGQASAVGQPSGSPNTSSKVSKTCLIDIVVCQILRHFVSRKASAIPWTPGPGQTVSHRAVCNLLCDWFEVSWDACEKNHSDSNVNILLQLSGFCIGRRHEYFWEHITQMSVLSRLVIKHLQRLSNG